MLLRAPCTLFFELVQVAPKGPSEIRVRRLREETVGIPLRIGVCGPSEEGVLAEEVIFKPNNGHLWLSSRGEAERRTDKVSPAPIASRSSPSSGFTANQKSSWLQSADKVYQLQR